MMNNPINHKHLKDKKIPFKLKKMSQILLKKKLKIKITNKFRKKPNKNNSKNKWKDTMK